MLGAIDRRDGELVSLAVNYCKNSTMNSITYVQHARRTKAIAGMVLILFSPSCLAAGAWLTETGGADMGMAGAGRGAMSQDGAALAANPAAIGGLPESTVTVALLLPALDLEFQGTGDTPGSAENESGVVPAGSLFGVYRADRLSLGLGVYSYLGLGFDLGNDWVGSRVIEEAGLRSINIAPTAAYRLTDRLGVGASIAAQYADVKAALGVSNDAAFYGPPVGLPDGRLELEGSSWAPGGSLGVLYRASSSTRLGLSWTSSVQHSVDMDLHGRNLHPVLAGMLPGPGQVELDVTLPQQLTLSTTTQLSPATLLGISTGWQDWSVLGGSKLSAAGQAASVFPDGLRDTWNLSVGIRHEVSAEWAVTAGVAYDSDPSVNGDMPVYFPVAEQLRIATGVERMLSEDCTLRMALSVVNQGAVRVEQDTNPLPLPGAGPLSGSFQSSRVYMLSMAADFHL